VLALNRRDSGRLAVESTVAQCLDDIRAGLLFLEKQGVEEVFLHGHSIGAYLALRYAAEPEARKLGGIILTSAIADFYRWDADHSRAEERSRAARQLERARELKDPNRKIIMEWSSTRDEGDSGTSSDRTFLKVNTAESVASFLGKSWRELLESEQSVASLIDQRLTQPENAAETIETPLLIIRSAADTHAPRSESLAIFHGAVHAAPTVLLEWDGLSGGSWLEPLRAHNLYPFRNGTSIAIDRWMQDPGWIPPFPRWEDEKAERQAARQKEAAAAAAREPHDPQLENLKQAFDEVRRWKTSFEPSDPKRLFTAKFNLLWRGTEEIRQPKKA
jgi:pimeloyl-ACP methyl ester carboxylesterase